MNGSAHQRTAALSNRRNGKVYCSAIICLTAALLLHPATTVDAESLNGALASAYRSDPRLDAERARLRATDESVPEARAGYLPRVDGSADVSVEDNRTRLRSSTSSGDTIYPRGYSVTLQQNLFDGFRTTSSVNEAEANVRAGRETLRNLERQVLLEGTTAYMDVVRDQAIVRLRENNVRVLSREFQTTQDRLKVGEVTKADLEQSRARRAVAVSDLDLARANLKTSRASYERVIGAPPSNLSAPAVPKRLLPRTVNVAIEIGLNESPQVIEALYLEQAARHSVDVVRGQLLPSLDLEAKYSNRADSSITVDETETATLTGRLNVPIYQGGAVSARVRASKHTHVSRLQDVENARREVRQAVIASWAQYQAAIAQIASDRVAVESNGIALNEVRQEERVGQRTLLDVLDAEQELLDAQVQLEENRRDLIVAAYSLLSDIGRLSVDNLGIVSTVYDPEQHYFEVRRQWWGISIMHADGRQEDVDLWDRIGRHRK